jgi:DNA modification methylase
LSKASATKDQARELKIEYWPLEDILSWPRNPKDHDVGLLETSIKRFGFVDPVIVDERSGRLAAGHGRTKTAGAMKLAGEAPPQGVKVDQDGRWLLPVVRGVAFRDDLEHEAYLVASNQTVIAGGWIDEVLKDVLVGVGANTEESLGGTGFDVRDVERLVGELDKQRGSDEAPAPPKEPWVKVGDLFALGDHRLLCGNSTQRDDFNKLTRGESIDCILSDPPYCSGGFQEADRIQGSIGTTKKDYTGQTVSIANDVLSTRGYKALISGVLDVWNAQLSYLFTDWRMWTNLTDTMESQGFGIRSMLVWDKGTPGMGRGWLSQHELIAVGTRKKSPFPPQPARGNVLRCDRSGNVHHPTEKPVDLLKEILGNTAHDIGRAIGEPFSGSGSTLIACEALTRTCYAMELSPYFVQVTIERWEQFTGRKHEQLEEGTGRTSTHVHGARRVRAHQPLKKTARRK